MFYIYVKVLMYRVLYSIIKILNCAVNCKIKVTVQYTVLIILAVDRLVQYSEKY